MSADQFNLYSVATSGSGFSFVDSISETTLVTITPAQKMSFKGIWLDLSNLTKNTLIKIKYDINNNDTFITYFSTTYFVGSAKTSLFIGKKTPIKNKIRVTLQRSELEGAAKDIHYEYWYENLGNYLTS